MSIDDPDQLKHLKAAGRVVAAAIRAMRAAAAPGVTTGELDEIGGQVFRRAGARSGPQLDYDFPGSTASASTTRRFTAFRESAGWAAATSSSSTSPRSWTASTPTRACRSKSAASRPSARGARRSRPAGTDDALHVTRAGNPLSSIGAAVEHAVSERGYGVCRDLTGHGIGRRIHEAPTVHNYYDPGDTELLTEGLVLTIEPIVAAGNGDVALRRRRLDGVDGRRRAVGARRAHRRGHCRCAADSDRLSPGRR